MSAEPVFTPAGKVLSPGDMHAIAEASRYLAQARDISGRARQAVEEAQAEGHARGYREGFDQGRNEALAALMDAVERARQRLTASDEELGSIVLAAVEQIVGEIDEKDAAIRCVRHALREAADDIWAIVRVSSEDHADVEAALQNLSMNTRTPEIKSVESDPLLKRGELILETPKGRIHVGLRQQLSRLKAGVLSLEG
jgi:type III secretion system HrpE/YscL family protein